MLRSIRVSPIAVVLYGIIELFDIAPVTAQVATPPVVEWSTYQHDAQRTGLSSYGGPIISASFQSLLDLAGHGGALAIGPDRRIWIGGNDLVVLNPDGSPNAEIVLPAFVSSAFGLLTATVTSL